MSKKSPAKHFQNFVAGTAALFSFLFIAPAAWADKFAAKRNGVLVYEQAVSAAKSVQSLKKGEMMESKDRSGAFWLVELEGGKKGFVRASDVLKMDSPDSGALTRAVQSVTSTKRNKDDSSNSGSARARTTSSVMGIRGLDEDDKAAGRAGLKPNMRAVYGMEDRQVSPQRVDAVEQSVNFELDEKK